MRPPGFLRDGLSLRQARRLRFPGRPRLLVLYHPAQYPLARALGTCHEDLEMWYIPPGRTALEAAGHAHARELLVLDQLARDRARQVLTASEGGVDAAPLRARLRELDVISPRAFIPGVRPRPR